jgi:hypothetical protein
MKSTRITPPIIAVIGAVLCLLAVGGITYFLILPAQNDTTAYQARYDAAYPDSTPAAQMAAKKDAVQAVADVAKTKQQWIVIENTLMPPYDVSQRYVAWKQLSNEMSLNLGPDIEHFMLSTGVVPLTTVALPPPPPDPNAITAAPLIIPLGGSGASTSGGGISVGGSFRQILHHIQLWNSFNRLVLVDNLALHGNSPYMKGDYGASVIIFPQNDDKLDKPIAAALTGTPTPGG